MFRIRSEQECFFTLVPCAWKFLHTPPLSSSLNITYRTLHQHSAPQKTQRNARWVLPNHVPYRILTCDLHAYPRMYLGVPAIGGMPSTNQNLRKWQTHVITTKTSFMCLWGPLQAHNSYCALLHYCLCRNQYMLRRSEDGPLRMDFAFPHKIIHMKYLWKCIFCVPSQNNTHGVHAKT